MSGKEYVTNFLFTLIGGVIGGATCLAIPFLFLFACVFVSERITRRRAVRDGYWVEYVSGRGERDEYGRIYFLIYHEGENFEVFEGRTHRTPSDWDVLVIKEQLPEWLKGRREIVVERIQQQNKRAHIVTKMEPL